MYGVLPELGFAALPAEEAIKFFNETIMVPYTAIPPPLSPLASKGSARLSAPFRRTRLAGGLMPPRSSPVHWRHPLPADFPIYSKRFRPERFKMPICEADPWRMQYFDNVACPADIRIPTEDGDAWAWYPRHKWIYNKLSVADSQGLPCGPHGLAPPSFPVFSKPIYNMRGMGAGTRILRTPKEYKHHQRAGHMWMSLLEGEHLSSDAAVVDGEPKWWRHVIGKSLEGGMFDYWTVLAEARPAIEDYCAAWIRKNLAGYTGMVNLETIGTSIIEVHLRFSDQWPDLYGPRWVEALVGALRRREMGFR